MASVPASTAASPGPAPSPAALLGPCIERIFAGAAGRKHAKLRQDAKVRQWELWACPICVGQRACCHHVHHACKEHWCAC